MTLPARDGLRARPQLRVIQGTNAPVALGGSANWRRVASAVIASTHDLTRHLQERHWLRVDEALRERRDLLDWFARLPLDFEGRRCLKSLCQAAEESERAIAAMLGEQRQPQ
ncbi:MAG TPA: hypothetical protein VFL16_04035 [Steroidobacteraceae bacterium]|nr:hypothetical protein [Steroidobacteraceae bacterium]